MPKSHRARARRRGQNLLIARIARPRADPLHHVAGCFENAARVAPYATVEQDVQAAESVSLGSTRSCATSRRAYARHARMSSASIQG